MIESGSYKAKLLESLRIDINNPPEILLKEAKPYNHNERCAVELSDYQYEPVDLKRIVGSWHGKYDGLSLLEKFDRLSKGEYNAKLALESPEYYEDLKKPPNEKKEPDRGFTLECIDGEYFITDSENRFTIYLLIYFAAIEQCKGDEEKLKEVEEKYNFPIVKVKHIHIDRKLAGMHLISDVLGKKYLLSMKEVKHQTEDGRKYTAYKVGRTGIILKSTEEAENFYKIYKRYWRNFFLNAHFDKNDEGYQSFMDDVRKYGFDDLFYSQLEEFYNEELGKRRDDHTSKKDLEHDLELFAEPQSGYLEQINDDKIDCRPKSATESGMQLLRGVFQAIPKLLDFEWTRSMKR